MQEHVPVSVTKAPVGNTYTSRPVSITAAQWDGTIENGRTIIDWAEGAEMRWSNETPQRLTVQTLEGLMSANPTDWIIRGIEGEYYPCKDSVFTAKYSPGYGDTSNLIIPPELRRQLESNIGGPIKVEPRSLDMTMVETHPLDLLADGASHKPGIEIRNIVLVTKADDAPSAEQIAAWKNPRG